MDARPSSSDDRTSQALASSFEEYRTLRAEITAALASQHAVLSYGIAALGLSTIAVGNAWQRAPAFAGFVLMTVIPSGIFLVVMLWGTELARMRRAGRYIAQHVEPRINDLAHTPYALSWERWLDGLVPPRASSKKPRPRSLNLGIAAAGAMWLILSLSSFAVGAYRFDTQARYIRSTAANDAKISAATTSPKEVPPRPTIARWFYRWWHFPWPVSAKNLGRGGEFWALFGVFILVPFSYASWMFSRNTRRLAAEFPPYIPTSAAGAVAELLRESTSEELLGFWPSYRAGQYDDAIATLTQTLQRYPDDPTILFSLACCESRAKRDDAALEYLRRAIDVGGKRILRLARTAEEEDFTMLKGDSRFRDLIGD